MIEIGDLKPLTALVFSRRAAHVFLAIARGARHHKEICLEVGYRQTSPVKNVLRLLRNKQLITWLHIRGRTRYLLTPKGREIYDRCNVPSSSPYILRSHRKKSIDPEKQDKIDIFSRE